MKVSVSLYSIGACAVTFVMVVGLWPVGWLMNNLESGWQIAPFMATALVIYLVLWWLFDFFVAQHRKIIDGCQGELG